MEKKYLTVNEAAALMKVTTDTIYRLIKEGTLKAGRIGGSGAYLSPTWKPASTSNVVTREEIWKQNK